MIRNCSAVSIINSPYFSIYPLTLFPCAECARAMIQAGIKKIISAPADHPNFQESFERSKKMLAEAGVEVVIS
jgi:deoxycytidylate deaminase